jgi:hypothetical protein
LRRHSHSGFTAICAQTNPKSNFESVASQRFQNYSWFGFERKALYVLRRLTIAINKEMATSFLYLVLDRDRAKMKK